MSKNKKKKKRKNRAYHSDLYDRECYDCDTDDCEDDNDYYYDDQEDAEDLQGYCEDDYYDQEDTEDLQEDCEEQSDSCEYHHIPDECDDTQTNREEPMSTAEYRQFIGSEPPKELNAVLTDSIVEEPPPEQKDPPMVSPDSPLKNELLSITNGAIPPNLPEEYSIDKEKGCILKNGAKFADGYFLINRVYYSISSNGKSVKKVELLFIRDRVCTCKLLTIEEIQSGSLKKLFCAELTFAENFSKSLENLFRDSILSVVVNYETPERRRYIHQGLNYDGSRTYNKAVYLLGDKVLGLEENECFDFESRYRLQPDLEVFDVPFEEKKQLQIQWVNTFINDSNYPKIVLIAVIAYIIRQFIPENLRRDYEFALFLLGVTSSGKSTLAQLFADIFYDDIGNGCNIYSLQNDRSTFYKLSEFRYCVVADDYHKNETRGNGTHSQEIVEDLIGSLQTGSRLENDNKIIKHDSLIIITAEDLINKINKLNRVLVVELKGKANFEAVSYLKSYKAAFISFLEDLIDWICIEHERVIRILSDELSNIGKRKKKTVKRYPGWDRIQNTRALLFAAAKIFNIYYYGKELISKYSIYDEIDNWIDYTLEKIDTKKALDPVVAATIRLLREPEKYGHKITKKYKDFKDSYSSIQLEDNYDDDKLIYQDEKKGLYYVQLDSVKQVLSGEYSGKEIAKILDENAIITKKQAEKGKRFERTHKISGTGKRFLFVYINKVNSIAEEYYL